MSERLSCSDKIDGLKEDEMETLAKEKISPERQNSKDKRIRRIKLKNKPEHQQERNQRKDGKERNKGELAIMMIITKWS